MPDRLKINEDVTIGAQPSEAELQALADGGVRTVINLRHAGEDMQPMSIESEGEKVRGVGMSYASVPVSMKDAGPELADRFRAELDRAEKPVFVHCKLGQRAAALVMLDLAVRNGWDTARALDEARQRGCELDNEKLAEFVKDCLETRDG